MILKKIHNKKNSYKVYNNNRFNNKYINSNKINKMHNSFNNKIINLKINYRIFEI